MLRAIVIIITGSLLSSCIKFTLSEEEVQKEFRNEHLEPILTTLSIGDRTIHYASINEGKESLLVWIHGSPGSWTAFIDYFKNDSLLELTDMISIDRPGFGLSDRGWPEPSLKEQSRLMHEVTVLFPHKNKILVGHSLGGPVIARMAMDYPDDYSRLLFLAPSIDPEMEKYEWYRDVIQTRLGGWLTPEDFWVSNEEILPLKNELREMLPLWKEISAKSIVIQGANDKLVPRGNADFAEKMIVDSLVEVRLLESANHFLPWNNVEEVLKGVYDLLE